MSALFDSNSEVNAIHLAFAKELGLPIRPIDVGAQKIDGTMLDTYEIVVAAFLLINKANYVRFFKKTFLMANVSPEIVYEMLFFTLSDADVDFLGLELRWRTYTTKKAFPTIKHIELVGKKEFVAVTLDPKHKTYIIYVGSVSSIALPSFFPLNVVHSFRKP